MNEKSSGFTNDQIAEALSGPETFESLKIDKHFLETEMAEQQASITNLERTVARQKDDIKDFKASKDVLYNEINELTRFTEEQKGKIKSLEAAGDGWKKRHEDDSKGWAHCDREKQKTIDRLQSDIDYHVTEICEVKAILKPMAIYFGKIMR